MKKILFLGGLFLLGALGAVAQGPWQFIEETDGVKVYYREAASGPIKELKLELTVDAKLSTIMAVLNDVKAYENWVFKCQEARVVKQVSDTEMYYYNEMDFSLAPEQPGLDCPQYDPSGSNHPGNHDPIQKCSPYGAQSRWRGPYDHH